MIVKVKNERTIESVTFIFDNSYTTLIFYYKGMIALLATPLRIKEIPIKKTITQRYFYYRKIR
jgi:hypothetical protein